MTALVHSRRINTVAALMLGAATAGAQQPFDLDMSFRTNITETYVNTISLMPDGKLLVSGEITFPNGDWRPLTRLNSDGSRDLTYPIVLAGGGRIRPWNDQYYVLSGGFFGLPSRLLPNGLLDTTFDIQDAYEYFSPNQGGDYQVYPDGSVVLTGSHTMNVPDSGWVGSHHMIWFNNDGTLDFTRRPRKGNGAIYLIVPQPDGKFLLSGASTMWEGVPVPNTFRVHTDGSLDPSFTPGIAWGECQTITVLEDGRLLATGLFKTEFSSPDTLHCVRMFADGTLDPTFNNGLVIRNEQFGQFLFLRHTYLPGIGIVLHGNFDEVDGHERKGFIILNEDGYLPQQPLGGNGCGSFFDGLSGITRNSTMGMVLAPDGSIYIHGAYHGYDDGTTNDPTQRFVSRLYGLDVGVPEHAQLRMEVYPNPASTYVTVELQEPLTNGVLVLRDALGREVWQQRLTGYYNTMNINGLGNGVYLIELWSNSERQTTRRMVVQ